MTVSPDSLIKFRERKMSPHGTAYCDVGEGEVLVLIHGVGMRLEAWAPQIEAFSLTHRVIAVDMPGHGKSSYIDENARLPDFVQWFGRFLADLSLQNISVAGHSMGALIAEGAAAELSDRVRRVALLNGVYKRDAASRSAVVKRAREIEKGKVDIVSPIERWFGDDPANAPIVGVVRNWLAGVDIRGYRTAYRAFSEGDDVYADYWPSVTMPSLFITGSDDPNSTPQMSIDMAAAAQNGTAVIIEGHRHMVNLTAFEKVNQIMKKWLDN